MLFDMKKIKNIFMLISSIAPRNWTVSTETWEVMKTNKNLSFQILVSIVKLRR